VEKFICNIFYSHGLRELEILVPGGFNQSDAGGFSAVLKPFRFNDRQPCNVSARSRQTDDEPGADRIIILRHDNGNCTSRLFGRTSCAWTRGDNNIDFQTHQCSRKLPQEIWISFCKSIVNEKAFSLNVSKLTQTVLQCCGTSDIRGRETNTQESQPGSFVGCCPTAT